MESMKLECTEWKQETFYSTGYAIYKRRFQFMQRGCSILNYEAPYINWKGLCKTRMQQCKILLAYSLDQFLALLNLSQLVFFFSSRSQNSFGHGNIFKVSHCSPSQYICNGFASPFLWFPCSFLLVVISYVAH